MGPEQQFDRDQAVLREAAGWIERWVSDRFDGAVRQELCLRADEFARAAREAAVTEQAAGVLAWQQHLAPAGAMALLRAYAAIEGRPTAQVAAGIVDDAALPRPLGGC